jgi:hypothetical protein
MSLNPVQLQELHDYIVATPALNGIPNTPDGNYEIAEILNTPSNPGYKAITTGTAMVWAANGPRVRIGQAANNPQEPESIRASCQVFLDLIMGGTSSNLGTDEPEIQSIFDGWLTAGVITQDEYDNVYGQPTGVACTLIPQSVELLNQTVDYVDVQEARAL